MTPSGRSIVLYFLRPYPRLFQAMVFMAVLTSVCEAVNIAAFFPVFQALFEGKDHSMGGGLIGAMSLMWKTLAFRDPVISAVVLLIGITLLKCLLVIGRETLIAYASGTMQRDMKDRLMQCYANYPYEFFIDEKHGKLTYTVTGAGQRVGVLLRRIPQFLADLLKVLAIVGLLLTVEPRMTAALALVAVGYPWLIQRLARQVSYRIGKGRATAGMEQVHTVHEFLQGIRHMLIYRAQRAWLDRFHRFADAQRVFTIKDSIWLEVPRSVTEFVLVVVILGFIAVSKMLSPSQFMESLSVVGVFTVALFQIFPALSNMGSTWMEIVGLMPDVELVYHTLTSRELRRQGGLRHFHSLQQRVVFDRVTFAHRGRSVLLNELSLVIERGRVTALVGPSGSGKTTIVHLLLGLFEPTTGRILVDGVDLGEYETGSWWEHIGFVSQDPFISNATVRENILFGRTGYSQHTVEQAAKIANAHGFVTALPQDYDTVVGERGMKLSGGQQQCLAITRAILHDPDILIFDEATSSLDTESERMVQGAIDAISKNRTVLIIAHRLSTVRHADKIVVLDRGRIVEEGAHEELIREHGRYFELVASSHA